MGSVVSEAVWYALLERDGWACLHCNGTEGLQPAHYISRAGAGPDDLDNLMLLCNECHRALHDGLLIVKKINGRYYFKVIRKRRSKDS